MSRWREHDREEPTRGAAPGASEAPALRIHARDFEDRPLAREQSPPTPFTDSLDLPRGEGRELVAADGAAVRLNGEDVRVLTTVGAFRAVPVSDLGADMSPDRGTVRHLREAGLLDVRIVGTRSAGRAEGAVAVLTPAGKTLLDAHTRNSSGTRQQFYAGLVKPNELAHDTSLLRVYQAARADLAAEGRRVTRVVLDYEIKAEYQRFLNRPDRPANATLDDDRAAFAAAHGLTVGDGHLEVPDLRLEFEGPDGERGVRDVELVTEHYSHSQLAGKVRAGFALYRASKSGNATRGGTPYDPHRITRVLA